MNIFKIIFLIVALPLCAYTVVAEPAREIRIGFISDLSGPVAYLGRKSAIGAKLAEEELLAEGRQVRVILGDSTYNTRTAVTEAQKLLTADDVDALMTNFTAIGTAVSPVAKTASRLFMYTAAAMGPLSLNPAGFKSYLDYQLGCELIARQWKKAAITKVEVLKPSAEYGELCLRGVQRVYPEVTGVEYQMKDEVRSQVLGLKARGIQAVMNATYEGDLLNMLKVMRELHFKPLIGTEETAVTEKLRSQFGELLEHSLFFGMPNPPQWFVGKVLARDSEKNQIGMEHAAMGYLHVKQLVAAISACAKRDLSCQTAALSDSPADSAFGFLGFAPDRIARFSWRLRTMENGETKDLE